jgi:hypothetical protein
LDKLRLARMLAALGGVYALVADVAMGEPPGLCKPPPPKETREPNLQRPSRRWLGSVDLGCHVDSRRNSSDVAQIFDARTLGGDARKQLIGFTLSNSGDSNTCGGGSWDGKVLGVAAAGPGEQLDAIAAPAAAASTASAYNAATPGSNAVVVSDPAAGCEDTGINAGSNGVGILPAVDALLDTADADAAYTAEKAFAPGSPPGKRRSSADKKPRRNSADKLDSRRNSNSPVPGGNSSTVISGGSSSSRRNSAEKPGSRQSSAEKNGAAADDHLSGGIINSSVLRGSFESGGSFDGGSFSAEATADARWPACLVWGRAKDGVVTVSVANPTIECPSLSLCNTCA